MKHSRGVERNMKRIMEKIRMISDIVKVDMNYSEK